MAFTSCAQRLTSVFLALSKDGIKQEQRVLHLGKSNFIPYK